MGEWQQMIQTIIDEIDDCIRARSDEEVSLTRLAARLGYSESYVSRKFRETAGMSLRDYLRHRRLAFALKRLRDSDDPVLAIALDYGFSSPEAFTRAFRAVYGLTPSAYRRHPVPVVLRTVLRPFDCYLLGIGGTGMAQTSHDVKTYFVTIPAHKFLHIKNYESIGYWNFWQYHAQIPGQDCDTICGLLDSIPGKLDDQGGTGHDSGSGQIMAYMNEPTGRYCSWGIPLAECYGVRLPADYDGPVPEQMRLTDIPEGEYLVFEHGPFDYETENAAVEEKIERAMATFDYAAHGCALDLTQGRVMYFYHDCSRFWKYVRPIRRV